MKLKDITAINFLLYSYFELTLDSEENEIINAAIRRAYRDASSRVLTFPENVNSDKKYISAEKKLYERIRKILSDKMNYDDWFYDTCEELIKSMNDDSKEEIASWTSGQDGKAHVVTINPGTYYLEETSAPEHFKIAEPIKFEVAADDNSLIPYPTINLPFELLFK